MVEGCGCPATSCRRWGSKGGDELIAEELGEDTIILKKINLQSLLEDAIEIAMSVNLDRFEERSRRRATSLQERSSRYILDNCVFIAAVTRMDKEHRTRISSSGSTSRAFASSIALY